MRAVRAAPPTGLQQPSLAGGVQPTTLRNAAQTSTTPLSIIASANGVSVQDPYVTGILGSVTDNGNLGRDA